MHADWLQNQLEETRRNPPHPGETIRYDCLGSQLNACDDSCLLGLPVSALGRGTQRRAPVTPGLGARLEALGWSSAAS